MKGDIVEELFKTYYNDALLYTLTLTKNKATAEDVVGTAFYKALETADDEIASFKFWLLRVCRNTFYSHLKREKRHTELTDEVRDERENLLEKIIKDEEYQALYRAIDLLPPPQKEVITLFYFENLRLAEIAKLTEKSEVNTKVILYRARENLKKILEA